MAGFDFSRRNRWRLRFYWAFVYALQLELAGCAPAGVPSRPAAPAVSRTKSERSGAWPRAKARDARAKVDPLAELLPHLWRLEQLRRPENIAYVQQPPPLILSGPIARRGLPFPPMKFAKVRAFELNIIREHRFGNGAVIDQTGHFIPSVALPGVELDAETQALLLTALQPSDEPPRVSMCAPHFRHGYVFYDKDEHPVAQLVVSADCAFWTVADTLVPLKARPILREVCERVGIGFCLDGTELGERVQKEYAKREVIGKPYRRMRYRSPQIDVALKLNTLSDRDKRLLCVWNDMHLRDNYGTEPRGYSRLDNWREEIVEGRYYYRKQSWDECVAEFPTCDVAISEVLACQEYLQRGDPFLYGKDAPPQCEARRSCLWGVETAVGTTPKEWDQYLGVE